MKSRLIFAATVILLIVCTSTAAHAVVDPDPDGVGVYFDMSADVNTQLIGLFVPFDAYVILTNPSSAEIRSFEFAYSVRPPAGMEANLVRTGLTLPPGIICINCDWDPYGDNVVLPFTSPVPPSPATILMAWQYMLTASMPVEFSLGATSFMGPMSGQLAYEGEAGFVPMHVSSGDPSLPVAAVNAGDVTPDRVISAGTLKAQYR